MRTTRTNRIFESGEANSPFVTVSAAIVSDSHFPFQADGTVSVEIDRGRLVVAPTGAAG